METDRYRTHQLIQSFTHSVNINLSHVAHKRATQNWGAGVQPSNSLVFWELMTSLLEQNPRKPMNVPSTSATNRMGIKQEIPKGNLEAPQDSTEYGRRAPPMYKGVSGVLAHPSNPRKDKRLAIPRMVRSRPTWATQQNLLSKINKGWHKPSRTQRTPRRACQL